MQLKDQAAIVTGGASGLGAATARRLAAQGAKVAVCDLNAKLAESTAAEIGGIAVTCDVSSAASAEAAVAAAEKAHGPARVLVNCAGIGVAKRVIGRDGAMPFADFDKVIQVNLNGTFNMIRLATTATPPISAATVSASLALRSHTATFAPCAASRRAVAAPNPDAPPVTMAAWSFNCMTFSLTNELLRRDHLRRRRWCIDRLDQRVAMLEHRALIDRTLVGDFAAINR